MIEILVFWLILAIVVGVIAGSRNRSGFGWFFLALIISPLIAGILVLALGSSGKACPQCAEKVQPAAKVCKHCGHQFQASVDRNAPRHETGMPKAPTLDDILIKPDAPDEMAQQKGPASTKPAEPNLKPRD